MTSLTIEVGQVALEVGFKGVHVHCKGLGLLQHCRVTYVRGGLEGAVHVQQLPRLQAQHTYERINSHICISRGGGS